MIFDGLYRDSTRINSEDLIDEPYTESKSKTVSWMFTKMNWFFRNKRQNYIHDIENIYLQNQFSFQIYS